ncbi:hypothetical protein [Curtobacterium sp. MCSS17_007]|uniref:hypothetical protein n=1 Tax=Curtobacterium sp. MCSS17_007 TaxID=2175646 RepID=UPI0011B7DBF9|nr:hypothetical protein [Curtobacterium sp. MCSS17_007]WIE74515.1 hypothetical protein DEJ22_009490 [Curtobacterium sp. MCSS17_007]
MSEQEPIAPNSRELEPDVTSMTEAELIELGTTLPSAVTALGERAMDEYFKRRGEVINRAMEERRNGEHD